MNTEEAMSAMDELAVALVRTVEYVGTETLPAIEGWSWYDALKKHRPDLLDGFSVPEPHDSEE